MGAVVLRVVDGGDGLLDEGDPLPVHPLLGRRLSYALYDGKFERALAAPGKNCSADELAAAISDYVQLFDRLMKSYLSGRMDAHEIEAAYYSYLINAPVHI